MSATLPVSSILPNVPWAPVQPYVQGASVTPLDENNQNVDLPQCQFVCINPGISAAATPTWTTAPGTTVQDGRVLWVNNGIYVN